jgi:hypothetical protein
MLTKILFFAFWYKISDNPRHYNRNFVINSELQTHIKLWCPKKKTNTTSPLPLSINGEGLKHWWIHPFLHLWRGAGVRS